MTQRGVLFDVDGTLVDSNDAHARSWVEALSHGGWSVPLPRVRALIGMGGDKLLPEVTGLDPEGQEGRRIKEQRKRIFRERYLPTLRPFPEARGLIDALAARGLRLGVASSAEEDELEDLLRAADAEVLLPRATSSSDAERSKPDPDIVHAALDRLGLTGQEVTLIGDTPYDVAAARRAGVRCVALRCGGWGDKELDGAAAVFADPAELRAHLDEVFPDSKKRSTP